MWVSFFSYFILKLASAIFYQLFISHQMIAFQKLWKIFLFHLKRSFRSRNIYIFVFPSSPLFPHAVSHYFRGLSKINLKVYDVINCLNKNSQTPFNTLPAENENFCFCMHFINLTTKIFVRLKKGDLNKLYAS